MAIPLWKLENAFAEKFVGKILRDRNGRDNAVGVFLDYPDLEDSPDQRFPSISILFRGMEPDRDMFDSDMDRVVDVDYSTSPPTFVMRRVEEFYDLTYDVTCFSLSAAEDRELSRWIESRFNPRDIITVDGDSYHVFRESFNVSDSVDVDTVVYEKSWQFKIKADIEDTENDDYQKGVNQVRIASNIVKPQPKLIEPTSTTRARHIQYAPLASEAEKTLHRVVAFDDQDYWFPKK